ncbi:MAG TPA: DUF541 domain-containing protein [Thermodesulfobacteriaceae bacterium]|nr:DUF541 domain-containing protein [Thermodesulfobacteriaceae bacterium]
MKNVPARYLMAAGMLLLTFSAVCQASESDKPSEPVVTLSAEAEAQVANDLITAVLEASESGRSVPRLSGIVNARMHRALEIVRQHKSVTSETTGYNTYPIYEKGRQVGWRVTQGLELKSSDSAELMPLVGELQQELHLKGLSFSVSPGARKQTEDSLITLAIEAFKQRAETAVSALGYQKWKLVDLNVSTRGRPDRPVTMYRSKAALGAEAAAPDVEAGTSRMVVTVTGKIALK